LGIGGWPRPVNGATVLHYAADFDRVAAITGQPTEWVVPKGSL
jgi:hypothetical protein